MKLKESVEQLKRMSEDQIHHRGGIERRLDERCDLLGIEMASLKTHDAMKHMAKLHDRVDAIENGVGAATDRTTRELEALQSNYKGIRMELDVARETMQSSVASVEFIQGSLRDVTNMADETHKKFVAQLEGSLNGALAAMHGSIVATDRGLAAFRDEVQQHFGSVQEQLDVSVNEALMVAKARLDHTNTRLDSCEHQFAELVGRFDATQTLQGHAKQDNFDRIEGLQKSLKDCQGHCDKLEEHTVSLMESTHALEKQLQESGNNSCEDLQAVKAHVKDLYGRFNAHQSGLKDLIADDARAREVIQSAVHDRFDALDHRHNDLENVTRTLAENMAKELKSSRDDIEQVHGLMMNVQQAWGTKTKGLRHKKQPGNHRQSMSLLPAGFLTPRHRYE